MKRSIIIALFALAALATAASHAYGACTDATIKGAYGIAFTGSQGGLPLAIVGVAILDGEGNFSSTFTQPECSSHDGSTCRRHLCCQSRLYRVRHRYDERLALHLCGASARDRNIPHQHRSREHVH
jgi:hypothetical protein